MMKTENLRYQNYENGWNSTQQMTILSPEATAIQDSKLHDSTILNKCDQYSVHQPTAYSQQQAQANGKENSVTFRENPSKARKDGRQSKTEKQGDRRRPSMQCTTLPFQGQVLHENVAIVRHYLQATSTNNNQQYQPYQEQRSYNNQSSFAHTTSAPNDFMAISADSCGSFNNGGNSSYLGDPKHRRVTRDISRDYLARTAIKQTMPSFSIVSSNKPPMNPLQSIKPKAYTITKQMSIDCRAKNVVIQTTEKSKFERRNSRQQLQPKQLDYNLQENQYEPDAQPLVSPTFSDTPMETHHQRRDAVANSNPPEPADTAGVYAPNMISNLNTYQNSMLNHAMHQFKAGGRKYSVPTAANEENKKVRLSLSKKKVSINEDPIDQYTSNAKGGRQHSRNQEHVRCSSLMSNGSLKSILSNPTKKSPSKFNAFSTNKKSFSGIPLDLSALNITKKVNYNTNGDPKLSKPTLKEYNKTTLKKRKNNINMSVSALKVNKQKTIEPTFANSKHSRNAAILNSGTTQSILSNNAKKYNSNNNTTTQSFNKLPNKVTNNVKRPMSRSRRPGSSVPQQQNTSLHQKKLHNYQTNRNNNSQMKVRIGSSNKSVSIAPSQQSNVFKAKKNSSIVPQHQQSRLNSKARQ